MNKHHRITLLAAACFGMPALALTVDDDGTRLDPAAVQVHSTLVEFHPHEIQDRQSMQRLFFRIRQAAEEVCRISSNPVGYERWQEHSCEAEAVAQAVRETGIPELNDYYFRGAPLAGTASVRN